MPKSLMCYLILILTLNGGLGLSKVRSRSTLTSPLSGTYGLGEIASYHKKYKKLPILQLGGKYLFFTGNGISSGT